MAGGFVLDANVLYSARLRDLFLELSRSGAAHVCWTDAIEAEWTSALIAARPELREAVERTASIIREAFPLAYLSAEPAPSAPIGLPDPRDEHVAQAALRSGATIVTFNLSDFPAALLRPRGLKAVAPDDALMSLTEDDAERLMDAARVVRARLTSPPVSASDYADGLERAGCPKLAAWLRRGATEF